MEKDILPDSIDDRERYWAGHFNTYAPNGYNTVECGTGEIFLKTTKKRIHKTSLRNLKTYKVKDIKTLKIIEIYNLPRWLKENNINGSRFRNLLCGFTIFCNGFCLPETDILLQKEFNNKNAKLYKVKHIESGKIIEFKNCSEFCKKNNITEGCFRVMLSGITKSSLGYCLPETNIVDIKPQSKAKSIQLKSPSGEIINIKNISKFCKENNLDTAAIYRLRVGKIKNTKGFTLPS